jgi:hypothetical protein
MDTGLLGILYWFIALSLALCFCDNYGVLIDLHFCNEFS